LDSPDQVRDQIKGRVKAYLEGLLINSAQAEDLTSKFVDSAVVVKTWSLNQLITLKQPEGELNIKGTLHEAPVVVYYSPLAGAKLLASVLTALIGGTNNEVLVGLATVSGILSITDVRTVASPAEGLLFWIVYSADGHHVVRSVAKTRFDTDADAITEIEGADFESALHSLVQLGCLRISGDSIEVSNRVILRWK
jgi:hypothetical protein